MSYTSYETTKPNADVDCPVIIMHGLLGSKSNWNSLSKAIHNKTKKKVCWCVGKLNEGRYRQKNFVNV